MGTVSVIKKRNTNVYLSVDLIEQAKALDLNLSATLNHALELTVKKGQRGGYRSVSFGHLKN